MRLMKLTLGLLCFGLSMSCAAVSKAEDLIGKVSAKVDELGPKVTAAVALAQQGVEAAKEAKATAEKKADEALKFYESKGAPTDSAGNLLSWAAQHPTETGGFGTLSAALVAIAVRYKRKKDEAEDAKGVLGIVVKGVENADPNAKNAIKDFVKANGGDHPDYKALIADVKES